MAAMADPNQNPFFAHNAWRILTIIQEILVDEITTVRWLQQFHLIARDMQCSKFHECVWKEGPRPGRNNVDNFHWRCPIRGCQTRIGIRKGSFFERSRLPLQQIVLFIHYWSIELSIKQLVLEIGWSKVTVIDWCNMLREICEHHLMNNIRMIGGQNIIVEIDESKFFHRKYHRGEWHEGFWVFGMVERGNSASAIAMPVANRDAATLIPLIANRVLPHTTIFSDQWRSYGALNQLGYDHQTVNHSLHFRDPVTGVHTNTIEGMWSSVKQKFRQMHGTCRAHFNSYLWEWTWRQRHQERFFECILYDITLQYPL